MVGGGILGSLHAFEAIRRGHEVVHLERGKVPQGASVRNFGLCWVSGRRPGAELQLALTARQRWEELGSAIPGLGFRPNGSLTLATNTAELKVLELAAGRDDAADRQFQLLEEDEAKALNPGLTSRFLGALWCPLDAAVEPRLALGAIRSHLEASGRYKFIPERSIVDVDDHVVIDHLGARHEGDLVLLAPGAADGDPLHALLAAPDLQRVRLQMLETEPLPRALRTSVADGNSLRYYPAFAEFSHLLPEQDPELRRYGIQLLCQQRLDGALTLGDTHAYDEPFSFDLDERSTELVLDLARAAIGDPLPKVARRWAGIYHQLRQVTDDRLYYRRTVAPGVLHVDGAGGRGMTLAPAIAQESFE